MVRMVLLAIPAAMLLAACGSPDPGPYYSYGYHDSYRYRHGATSYGYNDRAYAYPRYYYASRYRNLERPSDY